ncbi:hypothetical protein CAL7716_094000 [Calothrix sp. PCC 7716]|nr:hypothetical protein CAL7716_094000 [Calothrix sp. PCC 7716]
MATQNAEQIFQEYITKLYQEHLPSQHSFFANLRSLSTEKLNNRNLLGHLHLRYQAACHATRVMVYHIPHLDSPSLRVRKLRVINDDDGLMNGDTHHYQLTRAFVRMGAKILIDDEEFGSLNTLQNILDPITAKFILLVQNLYPKSLGSWCVIEMFADDWMRAIMNSLTKCFPFIKEEAYFADCFNEGIETRHAHEALDLTSLVIRDNPELLNATIEGARIMANGLDMLWSGFDDLLQDYWQRM